VTGHDPPASGAGLGAIGQETLDAEDDKGGPYDAEADELGRGERLPINEDAEEELDGGRNILEDAD